MDSDDIIHRFAFHAASSNEKRMAHGSIREMCRLVAEHINGICPDGYEKSLAITKLEETMMWANASLARETN